MATDFALPAQVCMNRNIIKAIEKHCSENQLDKLYAVSDDLGKPEYAAKNAQEIDAFKL